MSCHQYGRRIEADRLWTVYHVFSGIPAQHGGELMIGLSRSDATEGMIALNNGDPRCQDGNRLIACSSIVPGLERLRS